MQPPRVFVRRASSDLCLPLRPLLQPPLLVQLLLQPPPPPPLGRCGCRSRRFNAPIKAPLYLHNSVHSIAVHTRTSMVLYCVFHLKSKDNTQCSVLLLTFWYRSYLGVKCSRAVGH